MPIQNPLLLWLAAQVWKQWSQLMCLVGVGEQQAHRLVLTYCNRHRPDRQQMNTRGIHLTEAR